MTPEQWAREAMENAVTHGGIERAIAHVVRMAREDARKSENEACAVIVDDHDTVQWVRMISAKIRQRAAAARSAP